ncbi:hypothetical protein [Mycobacterium sp. E2497]|uniref:hypothetical protein n=1 Tax=Mycobacterium sp. E2497 TaxID=1834135 RepID=UPI00080186DB|nr:hypothetical protein [Mycobacterium sp. E2497]OBI17577.1 hypothetical protein A5713_19905 [Mycobacterium sp. E2497]
MILRINGRTQGAADGSGGPDACAAAKIDVTGLVRAYAQHLAPKNIGATGIPSTGVNAAMSQRRSYYTGTTVLRDAGMNVT